MRKIAAMFWLMLAVSVMASAQTDPFPGVTASKSLEPFPGVTAETIGSTPLNGTPSVIGLNRLDPAQMSAADNEVVSNLSAELSQQAALASFDISQPAWHYQQIVCPAFRDYVLLSFSHGSDDSGSSRFTAALPRNEAQVRLVSTYAHGALPFEASWNRPGTFEVFNNMLRRERGVVPMGYARNWLMIAVCYAELSGYPVQVLSTYPLPNTTLDMLRLDANQPQMKIAPDQSADITFSDVSRPGTTTNWSLHFDRHGQLTSASHNLTRQPAVIALKP
jgi:hypothetical protein